MIFDKRDPWLKTHTPPWDFGCNCQLEQITAKEAGKQSIQPMTPADQVRVESRSGFSFDPSQFFEEMSLPGSVSPLSRREILVGMRNQVEVYKQPVVAAPGHAPTQPVATGVPQQADIEDFLQSNKPILKNPQITKTDEKTRNVQQTIKMGTFSPELISEFGLASGEEQIFLSRGNSVYGLFHQQKGHDDEMWNGEMIRAIMETLQNKKVKYTMKMTPKKNNYINIEALDGSGYLTLIQKGANAHWEIVDAHCQASEQYKNKFNRI